MRKVPRWAPQQCWDTPPGAETGSPTRLGGGLKRYHSKVCTPVIHGGHVYFAWQKVRCLDWETGEQKWEGGSFGDPGSCVVTADDRLVVYGKTGKLALVETAKRSPSVYKELAVRDGLFGASAWPHVALAGGRVYCRDRDGNLACLPVGK